MDDQFTPPPPPPPPPGLSAPRQKTPLFGSFGRRAAVGATAIGLMSGAFAGGFIVTHAATSSASPSSGASATTPSTTTPAAGTFVPNEDPTHEAGESAAREAQENAGQMPTVP